MLESVRCPCCQQWHLRYFGGTTRYVRDDAGVAIGFATKKLAEEERIRRQKGATGWPQNRSDHFRRNA